MLGFLMFSTFISETRPSVLASEPQGCKQRMLFRFLAARTQITQKLY